MANRRFRLWWRVATEHEKLVWVLKTTVKAYSGKEKDFFYEEAKGQLNQMGEYTDVD